MRTKKTPNNAKSCLVVQLDLPLNKELIWHDCMFAKRRTSFKRKLSISALEDSSEKGTKRPVAALKNLRGFFVAERWETLCTQQLLPGGFTSHSFIARW